MEHAATGFLPCALLFPLCVLRSCCACYPSRCAHYASPRCASFVLFSADAVPAADPALPNAAFVAHAAVPVTSCLTAVVSHAVPRRDADLGLPSARQSLNSSGASAASALRPTASAAAAIAAAGKCRLRPSKPAAHNSRSSSKSNRDSSNSKCKHRFSLPHPGHVRGSPSAATSRTESSPTKTAPSAPKAPTGHG